MSNNHMKSWSALLVIMEMQIKTKMKYHYTLLEWQKKKTHDNAKFWQGWTTVTQMPTVGMQNGKQFGSVFT